MQCANPKVFRIVDDRLRRNYTVFIPCGKCYACQCASRAEWALRMKYEFSDKRNVSAYFLTLDYDDEHLPTVGYNIEKVLYYNSHVPISKRNYFFSVLDKKHSSLFLESLKHWFRQKFMKPLYYVNKNGGEFSETLKRGFTPIYDSNSLPRYYMTGEYGDLTNRAHYHLIVFFPADVHAADLDLYAKYLWPYGTMKVESHISPAAQNYVAKHQVKDCVGTPFQNLISPIFSLSSRYGGGIGRILKDDYIMKDRFLKSIQTGDKSQCYYTNVQSAIVYKIPIPRFLKKNWHPDLFSDDEMIILENESLKNAKKYIETCMLDQNDFSLQHQYIEIMQDVNSSNNDAKLGKLVFDLSRKYIQQDKERRLLYKRKKRNAKLQLLLSKKVSHSHI